MNILILNWRDPKNSKSGGAEIVTLEHAKAWVRKGHQVTWFTSLFPSASKNEIIEGVVIIRGGNSLTTYLMAPLFYFLNRKRFDIVIDEIHGLPYFTPLYVRKPIIAFIHEVAGEIWDYMYPFPINKIGRLIEYFYFKFYRNIPFWTVSESTKRDLNQLGIKDVSLIHNGVSFDMLKTIKEEHPTFIFISRLVKMKGIEDVLEAFAGIVSEFSDSKLWIVGTGEEEYTTRLKRKTAQLGIEKKVTFFGKISEEKKYELLGRSHLLLHASVREGWGLVVIEAASQMTPSVVYNVAGLRDSVKDQKTGIVTKENTPEALAKAAISLINDKKEYKRLQKNALTWAKSLTWDKATRKSLRLLESL